MNRIFNRNLAAEENGISAVEFGLIAPVVIMMVMGVMDIGHNYYVRIVANGALQETARAVSLESATAVAKQQVIDLRLSAAIKAVVPSAKPIDEAGDYIEKNRPEDPPEDYEPEYETDIYPQRKYYKTFSDAASSRSEKFSDGGDMNGICDNGETFVDENENGIWDEDVGTEGVGLAHDVVVMKVRFRYKRLFPTASILGFSEYVTVESDSVLANQPYAKQAAAGTATGNCD